MKALGNWLLALGCLLAVMWMADDVNVPLALVLSWPVAAVLGRIS